MATLKVWESRVGTVWHAVSGHEQVPVPLLVTILLRWSYWALSSPAESWKGKRSQPFGLSQPVIQKPPYLSPPFLLPLLPLGCKCPCILQKSSPTWVCSLQFVWYSLTFPLIYPKHLLFSKLIMYLFLNIIYFSLNF